MDDSQTDQRFDATWRTLERRGHCDAFGGQEYLRVRREWQEAGRPLNLYRFILTHANAGPARPA